MKLIERKSINKFMFILFSSQYRRGVFDKFKDGHFNIMVATDVASRGLDTLHVSLIEEYILALFLNMQAGHFKLRLP